MRHAANGKSLGIPGRKKAVRFLAIGSLAILLAGFLVFKLTPWPSAMLIRSVFNKGARKANDALLKHVPRGVATIADIRYDPGDKDALLDLYIPDSTSKNKGKLPVIVWIHGGGWISGDRKQVGNYCRILSAKGYVVVSIEYSLAPEAHYPVPLRQTNAALAFLRAHAEEYHIDAEKFILAGDSGGAHIAAQAAQLISSNSYAGLLGIAPSLPRKALRAMLLYCGPYDTHNVDLESDFGSFLKTVLWSYSGTSNFLDDTGFRTSCIINYIDRKFPPAFLSAGNGDPLLSQSRMLAGKLASLSVPVDTLFFPDGYEPSLPHEYQFNLDNSAGTTALERSVAFLRKWTAP